MRPRAVVLAGMLLLSQATPALSIRYPADVDHDGVLTVACLGDSNTDWHWPAPAGQPRWCEYLAQRMRSTRVWNGSTLQLEPVRFVNLGAWGAPVCVASEWQTNAALAAGADLLVTAFNTNDVFRYRLPPEQVVGCHQDLIARVAPRPVLIATMPPVYAPDGTNDPGVEPMNAALVGAFPTQFVDFTTGFTARYFYPDGIHVTDVGQRLRALIVRRALRLVGTPR